MNKTIPNWTIFGVTMVTIDVHEIVVDSGKMYTPFIGFALDDGKEDDEEMFTSFIAESLTTEYKEAAALNAAQLCSAMFGDIVVDDVSVYNEEGAEIDTLQLSVLWKNFKESSDMLMDDSPPENRVLH